MLEQKERSEDRRKAVVSVWRTTVAGVNASITASPSTAR